MVLAQGIWNARGFFKGCRAVGRRPGLAGHVGKARLPLHMLRYWITHHLLSGVISTQPSPRILEIGIDRGQLHFFARGVDKEVKNWRWEGADLDPRTQSLRQDGYRQIHLLNFEDLEKVTQFVSHPDREGQFDAVVVLHFLEHLDQPEAVMNLIKRLLKPGGAIVGGMPGCPEFFRTLREQKIRKHAKPHGHKSVFSAERIDSMARQAGLEPRVTTGAFFARSRDFQLENHAWWFRFNVWFGRTFIRWPSELYFEARRPRSLCKRET